MAATALVQTRIDPEIRDKASEVLAKSGLTVSDVTRIVLTRIANEGFVSSALISPDEEYDAWFRAQVQEARNDSRPTIPDEQVRAHFASRRAELELLIAKGK